MSTEFRSTILALPLLAFPLLTLSCAGPGRGKPLDPMPTSHGYGAPKSPMLTAPDWAGEPVSDAKLARIESWLARSAGTVNAYWVVEGHLELSEGNLATARSRPAESARRMALAREGFHLVRNHYAATASQRQRADLGLEGAMWARPRTASAPSMSGILPRSRWGAQAANPRRMDRASVPWRYITVHHSAKPGQARLTGSLTQSTGVIRDIQKAHMAGEGFGDIGYHFLIDPGGRVYQGRSLAWQGAHAGGVNNVGNLGVCLLGNFERDYPTGAALSSLDALIHKLRRNYGIPHSGVRGHSDWKSTACPGRHLRAHVQRLRAAPR